MCLCVCLILCIYEPVPPRKICDSERMGHCVFALQRAVGGAAPSCRVAKLLQVGDAVEMNESSGDHQDVEQLVGVEPDVTLAREEPLRDASGVQTRSGNIERRHEQQPAHLAHRGGFDQTLADDKVQGGNHAAQTQPHKHSCSDSSVLRLGKEVTLGDDDGGQSQYAHHYQVDEAGLRGAVEGVVQPGDKRAHDQEGDPTVVQLGEDSGDALRVAVDCVEEPGEGEAKDGSQEKHPDHNLLLERGHERHVGPEHVHQAQTEEKQTA